MWVEQHKMERGIGSVAVAQALKAAISELHLYVSVARGVALSVTWHEAGNFTSSGRVVPPSVHTPISPDHQLPLRHVRQVLCLLNLPNVGVVVV